MLRWASGSSVSPAHALKAPCTLARSDLDFGVPANLFLNHPSVLFVLKYSPANRFQRRNFVLGRSSRQYPLFVNQQPVVNDIVTTQQGRYGLGLKALAGTASPGQKDDPPATRRVLADIPQDHLELGQLRGPPR